MKIYYFLLIFILVSCSEKKKEKQLKSISNVEVDSSESFNSKESLSFQDLMGLSKLKAIEKYGTPNSIEQFVLDDAQGEFRVGVSYIYTEKERQSESILIDEVTWEKDKTTWTTVWYEIKGEDSVPKFVLSWQKGSEF